jgi:very-short-patch-repair endonuclease
MRSKAFNRRKNSTRTGWEDVAARLSGKAASASPSKSGARHPSAVEGGKQGAARSVERSQLELLFESQLKMVGIGGYVTEHRFHPVRKWRFDFAWLDQSIAVEIEGGTWSGGRHTRGSGFEADCEKYNEAAAIGWTVFRFTGKMVKSGNAIQLLREVMK